MLANSALTSLTCINCAAKLNTAETVVTGGVMLPQLSPHASPQLSPHADAICHGPHGEPVVPTPVTVMSLTFFMFAGRFTSVSKVWIMLIRSAATGV